MEASRVKLMLNVLSCLLLATNLVFVVVLWSRASSPSKNLGVREGDTTYPLVNVQDFEIHTKRIMEKPAWHYMKQDAPTEQTTRENEAAFSRYRLRPHVLRGVAGANTSTTILGHVVSCPVGLSPTVFHRIDVGLRADSRAATEYTLRDNQAAFSRHKLSPKMMKFAADANTTTTELCQMFSYLIGLSPAAFQKVLNGVPATIDVLTEVVATVNGSVEVYMDGRIRRGTDVAKAIALGVRAVFVGRPVRYGLGHGDPRYHTEGIA